MNTYIGLDISGTKIIVATSNSDGKILNKIQMPTPKGFQEGMNRLQCMIETITQGMPIKGMGATAGGPLNWRTGVISPLHQPNWRNVPLKKIMEDRWSCPFYIDVDTNVAALGEYYYGTENPESLLYVTVSTAMGTGFLINGKVFRGNIDSHPEADKQSIHYKCSQPENIHYEYGSLDFLEALVSGDGILRIYGKPAENLNEEEWEEVTYNLAQGLRNLATLYQPEVIVLGGAISYERGQKLIDGIIKVITNNMKIMNVPRIKLSDLGYETAIKGAIAIAIHGLN
ncbi:MAG: ROK family protein [Lentisphaeria bacterium]|nr:ROK family protein [Lentisphaeria bacterium]